MRGGQTPVLGPSFKPQISPHFLGQAALGRSPPTLPPRVWGVQRSPRVVDSVKEAELARLCFCHLP